ncbi:hypothetical protein Fmac_021195 [Flemingia macrophylla]|uniref:Uncharacterized protein n=1 Tax=Flemingia macrophylla TaxID=520843 RepID=A0ABD1LWN4_9FABA
MSTVAKRNDIATDFPILCPNFVNIRDSSCATPRLTSTIRESSCATPRLTYTLCVCIVSIVELKPMVTEVEEEDVDVVGEMLAFKRGFPKYLDAYQWAPKLVVNEYAFSLSKISFSCNIFRFTAPILPQIIHFLGKNRDNSQVPEDKILKALTV